MAQVIQPVQLISATAASRLGAMQYDHSVKAIRWDNVVAGHTKWWKIGDFKRNAVSTANGDLGFLRQTQFSHPEEFAHPRLAVKSPSPRGLFVPHVFTPKSIVNIVRRYWGVALIFAVVGTHAAVIGYVRSRVAQLTTLESTSIPIGDFCFQTTEDPNTIYEFRLHAVIEPSKLYVGKARMEQMKIQIQEDSEQLLRQVQADWLTDPTHTQIRERLMAVVLQYLDEPLVQRVLITRWIQMPTSSASPLLVSR